MTDLEKVAMENVVDSLTHAFSHFSEFVDSNSNGKYHQKWIVISVQNSSEFYLKTLLKSIDPNNEWFFKKCKDGRPKFPTIYDLTVTRYPRRS